MTYYIDSRYGNDSNDGLSRQTAFASIQKVNELELMGGDEVLFKSGNEYCGNLHPKRIKGTGIIRFGSYGVGDKPIIKAKRDAAICFEDFDEVIIENLAATNPKGDTGIHINNSLGGELKNITVKSCKVFHVNDDRHIYSRDFGGIICSCWSKPEVGPGWFDGLIIEDNDIQDVGRTGILLTSSWAIRLKREHWGYNKYISDSKGWWPCKGVEIRGNYLDRIGGDGIFVVGTTGAIIEWNTVYHINTNVLHLEANAGIWPHSSDNCLIQFNESAYALKPDGCGDAQGFDVDCGCKNTILQYNYSHDNAGGTLTQTDDGCPENMPHDNGGTIFRNNLSINDGHIHGEFLCLWGPIRNSTIENNTFISSKKLDRIISVGPNKEGWPHAKDITVRHNIFICNGERNQCDLIDAEVVFEENAYWGKIKTPCDLDISPICCDPEFDDITLEGDGMDMIMKFVPHNKELFSNDSKQGTNGQKYIGACPVKK